MPRATQLQSSRAETHSKLRFQNSALKHWSPSALDLALHRRQRSKIYKLILYMCNSHDVHSMSVEQEDRKKLVNFLRFLPLPLGLCTPGVGTLPLETSSGPLSGLYSDARTTCASVARIFFKGRQSCSRRELRGYGKAWETLILHFVHCIGFITRCWAVLKPCGCKGLIRFRLPLEAMFLL